LVETSPMVSAPAAKAVAKRKKRQNWSNVVSTTAECRLRCKNEYLVVELAILPFQTVQLTQIRLIHPFRNPWPSRSV
jgi:hypothetical protein